MRIGGGRSVGARMGEQEAEYTRSMDELLFKKGGMSVSARMEE